MSTDIMERMRSAFLHANHAAYSPRSKCLLRNIGQSDLADNPVVNFERTKFSQLEKDAAGAYVECGCWIRVIATADDGGYAYGKPGLTPVIRRFVGGLNPIFLIHCGSQFR